MELRHLRYFVAVAEELSFRRGAEREHVAQPSLSKQIKDLEGEVGVRLLDRDTAGVRLTDAGIAFLDEARAILQRAREAVTIARDANGGRRGRLVVGNVGAISSSFMPATMARFRERYPQVDVTLREMRIADQLSALAHGTIQVGLTREGGPLPAGFAHVEVVDSIICAVMSRDHPLARRARVSVADLAGETLLSFADADRTDTHGRRIQEIFAQRGIKCGPCKRVNSLESLIAMVAGSHGVTLLPRLAVARHDYGVVAKALKESGTDLRFTLSAVWRDDSTSRLARNFVNIMRESAGQSAPAVRG